MDDMDDFISKVHGLAPELFLQIRDLVTAVEPNLVVEITPSYRPPVALQLDRAIRKQAARQYYGRGTIFRTDMGNRELLLKWLASVPTCFRLLIERVEVGHVCAGESRGCYKAASHAHGMAREAKSMGLALAGGMFWASYEGGSRDFPGTRWLAYK